MSANLATETRYVDDKPISFSPRSKAEISYGPHYLFLFAQPSRSQSGTRKRQRPYLHRKISLFSLGVQPIFFRARFFTRIINDLSCFFSSKASVRLEAA